MKRFAYYNEFDPKAAAWLRELIKRGLIMDGEVDERSITDVQPSDLRSFIRCHFFAGIGGWDLAMQIDNWPEDEEGWSGSCPCQPFSAAGKQLGERDERHLWPALFSLIRQCRPKHVFGEQVARAIKLGWLDGVSSDLQSEGYAVGSAVLGAHSVGSPHIRQRLYWVANSISERGRSRKTRSEDAENAWEPSEVVRCRDGKSRRVGTGVRRMAHGIPSRVDLLRGYGNAIVPQVAAKFIGAYLEAKGEALV